MIFIGQHQPGPRAWPPGNLATMLVLGLLAANCAGAQPPPVSWEGSMRAWFTRSSVQQEDSLPRERWSRSEEDLLLRRIGYADAAAVGRIRLVRQCRAQVPGGCNELTLSFQPREVLYGDLRDRLDADRSLVLRLDEWTEAFKRGLERQPELAGATYLVFLKWEPVPGGDSRLRWAVYRPTHRLLAEVRVMYRRLARSSMKKVQER